MVAVSKPRNHYTLTPEHVIDIFNECQYDDFNYPGVHVVVITEELEVSFCPYTLRSYKGDILRFLRELRLVFSLEHGTGVRLSDALVLRSDGSKWSEYERHAEYLLMLGMAVGLVRYRTSRYEALSGGDCGEPFFVVDV